MTRSLTAFLLFCMAIGLPGPSKASVYQLVANKTQAEEELAGDWEVKSEIVWSESKYAHEGDVSFSEITINDIHGSLFPEWKAAGWKLVRNKVIDFTADKTLNWERESKLTKDGEYWFVKSVNKFKYKNGSLEGRSYHKQYLNGEFVGSYITFSKLKKKSKEKIASSL